MLRALPDHGGPDGTGPSLGEVIERLGARAHGAAILLLALPEAIPVPVPSAGAVLGVPLIAVSGHLAVFGERQALPARMLGWRLPGGLVRALAQRAAPVLARAERFSRPRMAALAAKERPAGMACLAMSVLLFLPVPLMNVPPALALVLLAWGLVQRDGVVLTAGLAAAGAVLAGTVLGAAALLRWMR